jgi:hypothetical protein
MKRSNDPEELYLLPRVLRYIHEEQSVPVLSGQINAAC